MDLPIPSHLRQYLIPAGDENCEYEVAGNIQCPCGNEEFEIWESNGRCAIRLVCARCGKEIILFDAGQHGWNGFVCGEEEYIDRTLPFQQYICAHCGKNRFRICVSINSQGREDFIEECVAYDPSFSADDWTDGFECIAVSVSCGKCGAEEEKWMIEECM